MRKLIDLTGQRCRVDASERRMERIKAMVIETVEGRAVFLRRAKNIWQVRWGRTVIANCRTWQEAIQEIVNLMGVEIT